MELIFAVSVVAVIWIVLLLWVFAVKGRLAIPPYQAPLKQADNEAWPFPHNKP